MQIVYVSTLDWYQTWQRHQSFATEFAKSGWKVFYLNNTGFARLKPADFKRVIDRLKGQKRMRDGEGVPHEGIELLSPLVVPPGLPLYSLANERIFVPRLFAELEERGLRRPFVVYSYLPGKFTLALVELLKPDKFIYDFVSNFFVHPRRPKDFLDTHRKLLEKADLLLTDSEKLAERLAPDYQAVRLLHHGVSHHFFAETAPAPVKRTMKLLCYFGTIDREIIDFHLIRRLAEDGYEVHLIGPVKGEFPERHPGVRMTPQLAVGELASEIRKAEVLLLPYRKTSFNEGVMPAKIFQCLATGKPVVSVGLPSLVKLQAEGLIYGAAEPEEFLKILRSLPEIENSARVQARIEVARRNSEERSGAQLREWIESLFKP